MLRLRPDETLGSGSSLEDRAKFKCNMIVQRWASGISGCK